MIDCWNIASGLELYKVLECKEPIGAPFSVMTTEISAAAGTMTDLGKCDA